MEVFHQGLYILFPECSTTEVHHLHLSWFAVVASQRDPRETRGDDDDADILGRGAPAGWLSGNREAYDLVQRAVCNVGAMALSFGIIPPGLDGAGCPSWHAAIFWHYSSRI